MLDHDPSDRKLERKSMWKKDITSEIHEIHCHRQRLFNQGISCSIGASSERDREHVTDRSISMIKLKTVSENHTDLYANRPR